MLYFIWFITENWGIVQTRSSVIAKPRRGCGNLNQMPVKSNTLTGIFGRSPRRFAPRDDTGKWNPPTFREERFIYSLFSGETPMEASDGNDGTMWASSLQNRDLSGWHSAKLRAKGFPWGKLSRVSVTDEGKRCFAMSSAAVIGRQGLPSSDLASLGHLPPGEGFCCTARSALLSAAEKTPPSHLLCATSPFRSDLPWETLHWVEKHLRK